MKEVNGVPQFLKSKRSDVNINVDKANQKLRDYFAERKCENCKAWFVCEDDIQNGFCNYFEFYRHKNFYCIEFKKKQE